jgi:hypothetical protein
MGFDFGYRAMRSGTTFLAASASPFGSPNTSRPRCGGTLGHLRAQLLGGASGIALPAASIAFALGVSFSSGASAQSSFNGTRTTTYNLTTGTQTSPFTFGPLANITTPAGSATDAVDADALTNWNVTNQGVLHGDFNGIFLTSQGTVTNTGSITGRWGPAFTSGQAAASPTRPGA